MKKNFKWLVLSSVLLFYSFLYVATSVEKDVPPRCDENCMKFRTVTDKIFADSLQAVSTVQCSTAQFCITVNDSTNNNWAAMADSACSYMKEEGLIDYTVNIIGYYNGHTLVKQFCP